MGMDGQEVVYFYAWTSIVIPDQDVSKQENNSFLALISLYTSIEIVPSVDCLFTSLSQCNTIAVVDTALVGHLTRCVRSLLW